MQSKLHSIGKRGGFFQPTPHRKAGRAARAGLLALTLSLTALSLAKAEELPGDSVARRQRLGLFSGYGTQAAFPKATYSYSVIFLEAQYSYRLMQIKGWGLDLLAMPQYNFTQYKPVDKGPVTNTGYEAGLNLGATIDRAFFKERFFIYLLLSAGPHYVSGTPPRQVSGFIFSDNLGGGFRVKMSKTLMLDLRIGYRHISNANLASPNGGVDGLTAKMGITFAIPEKL